MPPCHLPRDRAGGWALPLSVQGTLATSGVWGPRRRLRPFPRGSPSPRFSGCAGDSVPPWDRSSGSPTEDVPAPSERVLKRFLKLESQLCGRGPSEPRPARWHVPHAADGEQRVTKAVSGEVGPGVGDIPGRERQKPWAHWELSSEGWLV